MEEILNHFHVVSHCAVRKGFPVKIVVTHAGKRVLNRIPESHWFNLIYAVIMSHCLEQELEAINGWNSPLPVQLGGDWGNPNDCCLDVCSPAPASLCLGPTHT